MYYMTEYINHYYFNQDADTIYWTQDQINLIDARTGQILRRNIKKNPKLKELKPDTYGYMQAIYSKNMAIAAGELKKYPTNKTGAVNTKQLRFIIVKPPYIRSYKLVQACTISEMAYLYEVLRIRTGLFYL